MTRQEAFDKAARHLLSTGKKSADSISCTYSGSGCAIRPFIPDGEDPKKWDGHGSIMDIIIFNSKRVPNFIKADMDFFQDLQSTHDNCNDGRDFLPKFIDRMRYLATEYDLNTEVLDT